MCVFRAVIHVKTGCLQELLSLIKDGWEKAGAAVYAPVLGQAETYEVRFPYEKLADLDALEVEHVESLQRFLRDKDDLRFDELIRSVRFELLARI